MTIDERIALLKEEIDVYNARLLLNHQECVTLLAERNKRRDLLGEASAKKHAIEEDAEEQRKLDEDAKRRANHEATSARFTNEQFSHRAWKPEMPGSGDKAAGDSPTTLSG